MAEDIKKTTGKTGGVKKSSLIDPLYQKYTKSVIRALGSTEFYEFFMDAVSKADNRFQFSNRKVHKTVDLNWVDAVSDSLKAFQNIIANPRNVIREDELIVNVANAKKAGADVVRHLAQHAALVEDFNEESGDVRPSRLMQKYREDTLGLYENRLVFTTLENAFQFVKIRHDALFSAMSDEFGAKLKVDSTMETATELVHMDLFLHIRETDSAIETDSKNGDVFNKISKMHRVLGMLMHSQFAQQMAKLPRVKGAIIKTNVLKRNPDYHKIVMLLEFLKKYQDIGYTIQVMEQNPKIDENFQRDIYHNILFNYLVLKGYLEDEKDRVVPAPVKTKKRSLKPKFIKQIIEELTEDYDLPDIEIRKVLIEELTKEQLLLEEEAERRRLVEEQEQRKREEQERIRQAEEAEAERLRREEEARREKLRLEEEEKVRRLQMERMEREAEDRRRSKLLLEELNYFKENLANRLEARNAALARQQEAKKAFEDAAVLVEQIQQRKEEAAQREKIRRKEKQERARIEAEKRKEQERLAEETRIREEEALQEKRRQEQEQKDTEETRIYLEEIVYFLNALPQRIALREAEQLRMQEEQERREQERQQRLASRNGRQ